MRHAMRSLAMALLATLAATAGAPLEAQVYARTGRPPFPHQRHEKLFPTCTGCHAGAITGEASALLPPAALCGECHDGTISRRVRYQGASPRQDFLKFAHREHAAQVDSAGRLCTTCHARGPDARWLDVQRARPETCQSCHTHRATAHLAPDNRCATCHIPLARSRTITAEQMAGLPKPPSHDAPQFAARHAVSAADAQAQCATCHTRDSCARCHVNAAELAPVTQLQPDARMATALRGKPASYLTPDDHRADAWVGAHGQAATASIARCASCHAQPSCTVCHIGSSARDVIRRLPAGRSGAPGVQLVLPRRVATTPSLAMPHTTLAQPVANVQGPRGVRAGGDTTRTVVRVHPAGFERNHAATAASGRLTCEGCHAQRFCSDCHAGESRRGFHPANFVQRHAPESYGRDLECASCHNTEVFCRSCHQAQGIASRGQRAGVYHNGQPLWLLQHGQAARRGLQSCTTCHTQRDCMQCHSQRGWGVNPHGPDFDPSRLGARARAMCARCHISDPTVR